MKQTTAIRNKDGRFANVLTHQNVLIGKITLISLLFILAVAGCYRLLEAGSKFLHAHELVKYQIIKIEFHKPFEFVDNETMTKRRAENELIENITNKVVEEIVNPKPTPTPNNKVKSESFFIKSVEAKDNYTYQNHSKKPYYNEIIAGLKKRYTNWEDAAELEAKEGGFDPGAINPTSGACGLPQALPCKKMGCSLTNIDCQLDWMKEYVANRYTTIDQALKFRILNGWY